MVDGGRPLRGARPDPGAVPVVQHGVSMYFGSADRLNREHLQEAQGAGEADEDAVPVRSPLLGQRRRHATRTTCCRCPTRSPRRKARPSNIREVRDFLEVPICVENVSSYAEFHASEMTEWEFLNEVVERADCGILLDVNNIYVSSQNHGFDPYDYLNAVPHRPRRADPRRRALASSRSTSSIRTTTRRSIRCGSSTRTRSTAAARRHAARVGREHPVVRRSAPRGAEGQEVPRRPRGGRVGGGSTSVG